MLEFIKLNVDFDVIRGLRFFVSILETIFKFGDKNFPKKKQNISNFADILK